MHLINPFLHTKCNIRGKPEHKTIEAAEAEMAANISYQTQTRMRSVRLRVRLRG